jgi:hypothetical protein
MDLIVRLFLRMGLLFEPRPALQPIAVPARSHPPRIQRIPQ